MTRSLPMRKRTAASTWQKFRRLHLPFFNWAPSVGYVEIPMSAAPSSILASIPSSHSAKMSLVATTQVSFRSLHSHSVATRQPASRRVVRIVRSRAMLPSNFVCQKSGRVDGVVAYRQP